MGRITEVGSLISSPIKELQTRGKKLIKLALKKHDGNVDAAADALGVSRRTMFRWVSKLKLSSAS